MHHNFGQKTIEKRKMSTGSTEIKERSSSAGGSGNDGAGAPDSSGDWSCGDSE